jgi:hypothetical protein
MRGRMSIYKGFAVTAFFIALLAGCQTSLDVSPDGYGAYVDGSIKKRIGSEYGLPMLQFKIVIHRTLTQCTSDENPIDIRFLAKVTAEPHYVVGERYVIDYEALSNWSKTTSFELQTYDNGAIKSINAEANDQTAGIVGDVVKSGISLLSLTTGVPLGNGAPPTPGNNWACKQETLTLLKDIEETDTDLKTKTAELVALTDTVDRLERSASMNALTDDAKQRLEKAQIALKAQSELVTKVDNNLSKLMDRVTESDEIIWPQKMDDFTLDAAPSPKGKEFLMALFEKVGNDKPGYTRARLESTFQLRGQLMPSVIAPKQEICASTMSSDCKISRIEEPNYTGLYYRSPVTAQLLICQVENNDECTVNAASSVVVSAGVLAPQLAPLRVLPLSNGIFQNNVFTAIFRENGGLAKFNYDEKAVRGKEASGAIASGLDNVILYRDSNHAYKDKQASDAKAEKDAKKKAELDELDGEIARLEKQNKIETMKVETSLNAGLNDTHVETSRLNAKLALLEAQRKVREAQDALDAKVTP